MQETWIELRFTGENQEKELLWNSLLPVLHWDRRWLGFQPLRIETPEGFQFIGHQSSTDRPPLCDMGIIEERNIPMDKDFLLYRWNIEPDILIFDFRNYAVQARYLKRLAFYIEKPGFRGTLLKNEQLEGKHGWNAHDYSAESLSLFFNQATRDNFSLNPEEEELKLLLLQNRILQKKTGTEELEPASGAIISVTRESSDSLRSTFLVHEGVHGLFFTNAEFRQGCFDIWNSLNEEEQAIWKYFLYNNEHPYDSEWEYLSVTELAAYILQNPKSRQESYFSYRFARQVQLQGQKAEHLVDFLEANPDFFTELCGELESLLQIYYPLKAGDFTLIRPRALQDK